MSGSDKSLILNGWEAVESFIVKTMKFF